MIEIHSIPNCPNCIRLVQTLQMKGFNVKHRLWFPDDEWREMESKGIANAQFPVVFFNGTRLPAMTVQEYINVICGGSD